MTNERTRHELWQGFVEITPLSIGVIIYGLAFGLLAAQASLGALQVGIMGGAVFAGGSQIVAVERIVAGAGAVAALIAGIALNLRLLLITASVRDIYAGRPLWQVLLGAHLSTDENWALMLAERAKGRDVGYWYLVGGGLSLLIAWCFATVTGVLFAASIPEPKALGMDFAFTAAFIAIVRSLWKGRQQFLPWLTSMAVVIAAVKLVKLDPSWALVLGGIVGAATAGLVRHG